ncbi:hypothetical protein MTO96_002076 [Rhipicephalus appendiculatus]
MTCRIPLAPRQTSIAMMAPWGWSLVTATLTVVIASLLVLKKLCTKSGPSKGQRLPPGPRGVPILGYLPFVTKPYHVVFKELSEKFGPIVRVRLGCKDVVVLNDTESIREGLTNPDILFRPDNFVFNYFGVEGIASMNGELWQVNRRYCFHVLRNLGFAKKSMEKHIQEEVQCFTKLLASTKGRPSMIAQDLAASVVNNISALVFGERYEADDPKGHFVVALLRTFLRNANFFWFMDFLPVIRVLANFMPYSRFRIMGHVLRELTLIVRNEVKRREGNMEEHFERDFLDGYVRQIQENKNNYNLRYLEGHMINFYGAATNPVRTAIMWNLLIAASDPDGTQAHVQREIDAVVGSQRAPAWEDRRQMPFTIAAMLEALRWRTLTPIGIQRALRLGCREIVVLNDLESIRAGLSNPDVLYRPKDFLLSYLGVKGKRACPGETLGLMEVFLYVATLLQQFRVLPEDGTPISLEAKNVAISVANDTQKLRFVRR